MSKSKAFLEDFRLLRELMRSMDVQSDMMELLEFGSDDWSFVNAVFGAEYADMLQDECEANDGR